MINNLTNTNWNLTDSERRQFQERLDNFDLYCDYLKISEESKLLFKKIYENILNEKFIEASCLCSVFLENYLRKILIMIQIKETLLPWEMIILSELHKQQDEIEEKLENYHENQEELELRNIMSVMEDFKSNPRDVKLKEKVLEKMDSYLGKFETGEYVKIQKIHGFSQITKELVKKWVISKEEKESLNRVYQEIRNALLHWSFQKLVKAYLQNSDDKVYIKGMEFNNYSSAVRHNYLEWAFKEVVISLFNEMEIIINQIQKYFSQKN